MPEQLPINPDALPLAELTLTLARVKGLLLTEEKVDRAVQLLAEGIRDAFPESAGAGVSLLDERGRRTSAGATGPLVIQADQAQYELDEGPCLTAWATERTVILYDTGVEDRWPLWTPTAKGLAIASAISVPMTAGTTCIGALKLYSTEAKAYNAATARPLEKLAATAATLLDNIQISEKPHRFSRILIDTLTHRDTINRAQGYLMSQLGLGPDEAFEELLHLSRTSRQSLASVSSEILSGTRNTTHDRT
ncbi:GAF and ANTAR domain-containing protein [Paenarthrobacter histidinolovorans]|uniref:GAF and ANTAR domain-containing protein n=1 Tax=Paenarthrobacter histidinolovorans TaxID=43664 RepID=UPI0016662490|nr:GAF and ANTAR domain-containing protein [Paenarthrobacter histidinolovorans]GGJ22815.1 transcriptional regulator [Paenarthrobacter histidinolovorans]